MPLNYESGNQEQKSFGNWLIIVAAKGVGKVKEYSIQKRWFSPGVGKVALRLVFHGQSFWILGEVRMVDNMWSVNSIDWWHPIVQTKWKVLVQEIGALIRAADEIE